MKNLTIVYTKMKKEKGKTRALFLYFSSSSPCITSLIFFIRNKVIDLGCCELDQHCSQSKTPTYEHTDMVQVLVPYPAKNTK